jgi:hypothetical protein
VKRLLNLKLNILRWYPIVANVWLVLVMSGFLFGIDIAQYTNTLLGCCLVLSAYLFVDSLLCKFCLWHQVLVTSQAVCLSLQFLERIGVGFSRLAVTILIISIFSIFVSLLLYKQCLFFTKIEIYVKRKWVNHRGTRDNQRHY